MTTIAFKNGIMAGETQITNGGMIFTGVNKVFRLDHCLIGIGGDARAIQIVLNWMSDRDAAHSVDDPKDICRLVEPHEFPDIEFEVLLVCIETGEVIYMDQGGLPISLGIADGLIFAIGTGQEIAMGAMRAGASAEEAVRIACALDIFSGGEVCTVSV